jgi:uncharacterized membrane protein YqjE
VSAGLLHSAQSLLAGLVALGRTRLELFSTELQEALARQATALLGAFVVLLLGALAAAFGAIALIIAVGEHYRLTATIAMAALFLALAIAAAWSLRHLTRAKPRPFLASMAQLERVCDALKQ